MRLYKKVRKLGFLVKLSIFYLAIQIRSDYIKQKTRLIMDKKFKILEELHYELAKHILDKIKSGEAKAGDLNVARQFLKDNGIECIPVENNPMTELMNNL